MIWKAKDYAISKAPSLDTLNTCTDIYFLIIYVLLYFILTFKKCYLIKSFWYVLDDKIVFK